MLSQYYQEELGLKGASGLGVSTPRELNLPPPLLLAPSSGYGDGVLHPKISEVWSLFFRQLPNFSDSYRILQTAIEFYQQLPIFSDEKRPIFPDRFLRLYLRTAESCLRTSLPFPQPPDPVPPPPDPAPPFCPAGPVELRLPPPATCTKRPNFTDTATEFCRQLPNFSDRDTEFRRQSYRILPTEIPNFADRDTEFCLQKRGGKRAHLFTVSTFQC